MKISTKSAEEIARLDIRTPEQKERAAMILEVYKGFKSLPTSAQFEVIEHFQNEYPEMAQAFAEIMRESVDEKLKSRKRRKR